ncbi:hypothetical protein [Methylobacterium indicum]|nr:hypothetical protein [Methylobacterium indicum]
MSRTAGIRQLIAAALIAFSLHRADVWRDRADRLDRWSKGEGK